MNALASKYGRRLEIQHSLRIYRADLLSICDALEAARKSKEPL